MRSESCWAPPSKRRSGPRSSVARNGVNGSPHRIQNSADNKDGGVLLRANTPSIAVANMSKRGTPRQSVASVRSSKVLTDRETDAPSAQTQETTGQKPSICPSVQSVRENADTNGARASVPAQTDRTDRQTPAQRLQKRDHPARWICLA